METLNTDPEYNAWLEKQDKESMTEENLKKFEDWFVDQVRNHGLVDLKFGFCSKEMTRDEAAKIVLGSLENIS
mgnify:CR=1 FL=1